LLVVSLGSRSLCTGLVVAKFGALRVKSILGLRNSCLVDTVFVVASVRVDHVVLFLLDAADPLTISYNVIATKSLVCRRTHHGSINNYSFLIIKDSLQFAKNLIKSLLV
jgi:hypothetical protein